MLPFTECLYYFCCLVARIQHAYFSNYRNRESLVETTDMLLVDYWGNNRETTRETAKILQKKKLGGEEKTK